MSISLSEHTRRVDSSMLWSAWADALGWISELTSASNLQRRTKGRPLTEPMEWQRQIGGRMGVRVNLPAGCYSDDTQLRLATARSISSSGFDVEAFSRVELPVWQAYALGGGRASKSAATSMARQNANWAANFYSGWQNSGGNGAAMRIQPHVYAAGAQDRSFDHLEDVIKNAVTTHGHPRALVGAIFHATVLTIALREGRVPDNSDWNSILGTAHASVDFFDRVPELSAYWRPTWEKASARNFEDAWHAAVDEVQQLLNACIDPLKRLRIAGRDRDAARNEYEVLVSTLGLDDVETRGSGIATAIAATILALAFPEHPAHCAQLAASRLDTDTDTIATMAAAIVGATIPTRLQSPVQDNAYISHEATRLSRIAAGENSDAFPYPDLLKWNAPKTALDSVGVVDGGGLVLAGFGSIEPFGETYSTRTSVWQWAKTSFGPTMLLKRRPVPPEMSPDNRPYSHYRDSDGQTGSDDSEGEAGTDTGQSALFETPLPGKSRLRPDEDRPRNDSGSSPIDLDLIFEWLRSNSYSDKSVGYAFRRILTGGTAQQLIGFVNAMSDKFDNGTG